MKRDDLLVVEWGESDPKGQPPQARAVSDAELAEMGYVKLPDCEACEGFKFVCAIDCGDDPCTTEHWDWFTDEKIEPLPCLSCGGSGKGRLVNLTGIDVEALRDALDTEVTVTNHTDAYGSPYAVADMIADDAWIVWEFARQILAALDKGETE